MILYYFIFSGLLSGMILFNRKPLFTKICSLLFGLGQTLFTIWVWMNPGVTEGSYFTYNAAGKLLLALLLLIYWGVLKHSFDYLKTENNNRLAIYHSALSALTTSITAVYLANDITAMWVFVEATTLSVAMLIYHDRTRTSLEATWKYIFVCSVGIAIAYFGILFLSASVKDGHTFSMNFAELRHRLAEADPLYLKIAFLCVLVGYSTKMELFPMHTVGIDANTVAPPPVSAIMSTALMNVGFLAIFRVYEALSETVIFTWMSHVLILAGIFSLIVSAAYMQKVRHLKRMLAYSSLENIGIVSIGLGIGGWAAYAAFLHLILHSLIKSSLFFQLWDVRNRFHTYEIEKTGNYLNLNPWGAGLILLGTLGITAIPPSGLFISELYLFKALIKGSHWAIFVSLILLLTFILYSFVSRVLRLLYHPVTEKSIDKSNWISVPALFFLLIVISLCFFRPEFLHQHLLEAVQPFIH